MACASLRDLSAPCLPVVLSVEDPRRAPDPQSRYPPDLQFSKLRIKGFLSDSLCHLFRPLPIPETLPALLLCLCWSGGHNPEGHSEASSDTVSAPTCLHSCLLAPSTTIYLLFTCLFVILIKYKQGGALAVDSVSPEHRMLSSSLQGWEAF